MKMLRVGILAAGVLCVAAAYWATIPKPVGGEKSGNQVFVKTFDAPEGVWADVVEKDDTPMVQHWWQGKRRRPFSCTARERQAHL
jgi:hypothetical protein